MLTPEPCPRAFLVTLWLGYGLLIAMISIPLMSKRHAVTPPSEPAQMRCFPPEWIVRHGADNWAGCPEENGLGEFRHA